jgi:gluconolactonase
MYTFSDSHSFMKAILLLLLFTSAAVAAADYIPGPDSKPQPGVPRGIVKRLKIEPGKLFPGTPHNYAIYIPAQYDPVKPTPFMIFLDGLGAVGNNGMGAPIVFDNLIAKHDLPPMIGIFVDPGSLPVTNDRAQNRFERVFEYDSLSDRYSRFLLEELIPEVARNYNLSKDPNDRGLSGNSTGAVGAFVAAWNRPDQFRRVLSFIGTYVAMKGADGFPALIRRTEPKPIRIFLQDGKNDHIVPAEPFGTFYAGSWPINNQVMYEAFQFSGYDVKLEIGTGGHDGEQRAAILPDALRWLWRGYPAPVTVHEPAHMTQPGWDPRGKVYSTVWADKGWEKISDNATAPANDRDGNVYFADATRIYKSSPEGMVTVFRENASGIGALRVGPDGRLYASQIASKKIVSIGPNGDEKLFANNVEASDIAITAKGGIYFSDATHRTLSYVDPTGKSRVVYDGGEIAKPFGVALSPDQAILIVSDAQSRFSWSFQITENAGLANGEPFYRLEMPESGWMSNAQSVAEDAIGQIYFATPQGIQVCEANGRVAQILNSPEYGAITSVAFAGKDLKWLYVTENGKLFRRPVKVTGTAAWSLVKPPKPPM